MDIAASIQLVIEEVVLRLASNVYKETGMKYLCLAGGVALNCVANGRILREGPFEDIWIQPAAGGAIGAAAIAWYEREDGKRVVNGGDVMQDHFSGRVSRRTRFVPPWTSLAPYTRSSGKTSWSGRLPNSWKARM